MIFLGGRNKDLFCRVFQPEKEFYACFDCDGMYVVCIIEDVYAIPFMWCLLRGPQWEGSVSSLGRRLSGYV